MGQRGIPIFTDLSKLGGSTGLRISCSKLGLELHFMLNDDCRVFQAEIFAILKAIEAIYVGLTSDSGS